MNEKIYNYKKNLIIKSVYEISQKLENKYPISRKYKIKTNFKEKKIFCYYLHYNINYIIYNYF